MNQAMWAHPATRANAEALRQRGVTLVGPASGDQACGETGAGRMVEPDELVEAARGQLSSRALAGRSVLVTAGPTHEPLDPVRYLANASSGRMGFAIAEAAARAGARVALIAGPTALATPDGVERIDVTTASQMHAAAMARVADFDVLVATAAVSDYRPAEVAAQKVKNNGQDHYTLALAPNPDILAEVAALSERPLTVGFAAETEDAVAQGEAKRRRKGADLICVNEVGGGRGFGDVESRLELISDDARRTLGPGPKPALARGLIEVIGAELSGSPWPLAAE
jgi:phosphopantothenoylcysteine decarboxylase/phosphopantothenate--cysteine ligase